ncbi:MAG: DEAD/DEAH box helicase family protein, partial [Clostridia bacterium]
DFCKDHNILLKQIDKRIEHKKIDCTLINTILDSNQKNIVKTLVKNEGGLIEAAPGIGKTISVLGLISEIKQPTLILVHEFRLSKQWINEIKSRLIGNFTLGELNGERHIDGDIVVAIIDTVDIMYKKDSTYFDKFGMLIVDECHHTPADTFINFVNNNPAKYRVGVTGTIKRSDGKHILIYDVLGEKLLGIEAEDAKNRITGFNFDVINTNIPFIIPTVKRWTGKKRETTLNITECITSLTKDIKRNNLIIEKAVDDIKAGHFPLILSDRTEHNKTLHEHLISLGYKAILLIGTGKTRKIEWEDIQNDKSIQCIVANTKIASEALDLPRLSSIIPTCPTSNLPKVKQQLGRIRRVCEGKKFPIIHDVCDNLAFYEDDHGERIDILRKMAVKRIKFYRQLQEDYNSTPEEEDGLFETVV